jgi:hypothetical protein
VLIAAAASSAFGCGSQNQGARVTATADPPRVASIPRPQAESVVNLPSIYRPSAEHSRRPAHSIYNDEIGENLVGLRTPEQRVESLFGRPLAHRTQGERKRVYYRLVGSPLRGWVFYYVRHRMVGATVSSHADFFRKPVRQDATR